MEVLEENEVDLDASLEDTMRGIGETTFEPFGYAIRSVHATSHGILCGTLKVMDNLPGSVRLAPAFRSGTQETVLSALAPVEDLVTAGWLT